MSGFVSRSLPTLVGLLVGVGRAALVTALREAATMIEKGRPS